MENKQNSQNIDIKFLLGVILRNWIFIVLTTIIFLAVAIVYLKLSSQTFLVSTKILIDVDDQRQRGGTSEYFDVNELMRENKSLQNELVYLSSTPLIKEVVEDMNMITSYYMQEGRVPIPRELMFTLTDIYKQSPFIVVVDENHPQPLNTLLYVRIRDDETFAIAGYNEDASIYDFKQEKTIRSFVNFNLTGIYRFGQTVENEHCSFKVLLNSNYNPEQYLDKELFFKFNSPASITAQFRSNLMIQPSGRESSMVNLSFQWSNVTVAKEFVENLVNKYIEKDLEAKNRLANKTIEYIDNQLSNISGSLGRSEQQLQNFRSSSNVMNINERARTLTNQINQLESERDEIESDIRSLQQIRDYFEANKDEPVFIAPSLLGLEDDVLSELIQEMVQLTREKQDLINRNQIRSPRLKTLNQNIDNIKRVISENINLLVNAASSDLQEVESRLANLEEEYARLPQTQRRMTGLERDFNITDAAYTALLNKSIEAQIARASNESDIEIIEPVKYNGITSPNYRNIIAMAIAFGLMLPILVILTTLFLSDRIKNIDEISRYNKLRQVGYIPHAEGKNSNVVVSAPHTPISEAFHTLRSNLVYYLLGEKNKTILVTSSVPNEGKSFSALNLATSFASTHNKTLLVSFDMRKGSRVFKDLKEKAETGMSSYLINQASLDDIIVKDRDTGINNLDYIDNGEIPPDPVALISLPKTKDLFAHLKQKYDYIIIDTPPYDVFTDAFLLMGLADIKLFVSRIGVVTRKALRSCISDFNIKNIENIFMMVNDVKHLKDSKYSYYREKNKKRSILGRIFKRKKSS